MKIALDHDSTIAATCDVAFDLMEGPDHGYSYDDIESWTWGIETFGKARYLNALWHAWTLRPLDVPLMDPTVRESVSELVRDHEVHVVTAHPDHVGIEDGKKEWLDDNEIPYDEFHVVPTDDTKAVLDYDVYIDDKPDLPEAAADVEADKTVYVRDHPYNRAVEADHVRVGSISEAVYHIQR